VACHFVRRGDGVVIGEARKMLQFQQQQREKRKLAPLLVSVAVVVVVVVVLVQQVYSLRFGWLFTSVEWALLHVSSATVWKVKI